MSRQLFMVAIDVPDGVTLGEFVSHLTDAHRSMVATYAAEDPMSAAGEIEVFAAVASCDLPAVQTAEPGHGEAGLKLVATA